MCMITDKMPAALKIESPVVVTSMTDSHYLSNLTIYIELEVELMSDELVVGIYLSTSERN